MRWNGQNINSRHHLVYFDVTSLCPECKAAGGAAAESPAALLQCLKEDGFFTTPCAITRGDLKPHVFIAVSTLHKQMKEASVFEEVQQHAQEHLDAWCVECVTSGDDKSLTSQALSLRMSIAHKRRL
jgi:hypothetical protein